jgi:Crp-like helix-turn-helix domain
MKKGGRSRPRDARNQSSHDCFASVTTAISARSNDRNMQTGLALMLGSERTTVTVTARALQAAGLIKYSRGHVTILDREGIEEAACECYGMGRKHFDRLMSLRPA